LSEFVPGDFAVAIGIDLVEDAIDRLRPRLRYGA
jgi:hypothetical protein